MESDSHRRLKLCSLAWLAGCGVRIRAAEVVCPLSRFRIDIAGYIDPLPRKRRKSSGPFQSNPADEPSYKVPIPLVLRRDSSPRTIFIECKAFRGDFLNDASCTEDLIRVRNDLAQYREALEEQILRVADPAATREADWLFDDLAAWDFSRCRTRSYREVVQKLQQTHKALHGRIKFEVIARYALADVLLIAAPTGMISFSELPPNWGLVEFSEHPTDLDEESCSPVRVRFAEGPQRASPAGFRARLLRNIAAAATHAAASITNRPPAHVPVESPNTVET